METGGQAQDQSNGTISGTIGPQVPSGLIFKVLDTFQQKFVDFVFARFEDLCVRLAFYKFISLISTISFFLSNLYLSLFLHLFFFSVFLSFLPSFFLSFLFLYLVVLYVYLPICPFNILMRETSSMFFPPTILPLPIVFGHE